MVNYCFRKALLCSQNTKNILHLIRGQVFEIEGKKIFTFGGAYSIDIYEKT